MAKNVTINGVNYQSVPQVEIPNSSGGGNAVFYDTSVDSAVAGDVVAGKTFHGASGQATGSMTDNGTVNGTISTKSGSYTIPAGKHSGSGKVQISSTEQAKIIAANIRSGATILGQAGSPSVVDTADATATGAQILNGKTAYINGQKVTGSMTAATVAQDGSTKVLSIS